MKVTEDAWTIGMIDDGVFAYFGMFNVAQKIAYGMGTRFEPQEYDEQEREWASAILRRHPLSNRRERQWRPEAPHL